MAQRLIVGCMTGTSLDAIDAALVRVDGEGLDIDIEVVRTRSEPLKSLGRLLRPIIAQRRRPIGDAVRYAHMIGVSTMLLVRDLLDGEPADLIAVHGETVYHETGCTSQLINPHPIVSELRAPVAYDFRRADLAAGGQGAPITPIADHILYRDAGETRAIVNLGGYANYTWLPPTQQTGEGALTSIRGGDICACNHILNYVARRWLKKRYDKGGKAAANGIVHPEAEQFLAMLLNTQSGGGRALGTGDESTDWARTFQHHCNGEDLAATACSVIGQIIATVVRDADRIILAGGSALNETLVDSITANTRGEIHRSDDFGVPAQFREAVAMAILGSLALDRIPYTLPQITGRAPGRPVGPSWVYP